MNKLKPCPYCAGDINYNVCRTNPKYEDRTLRKKPNTLTKV